MPEHVPGTNRWHLFAGEYFLTTDREKVNGPLVGLHIQEFPEEGLLSVQGPTRLWEVKGVNFEKVVKKEN